MANPQLEAGHTKIANEILEALCRINLTAHESRLLWCILRKTYGWNKKADRISYSQFQEDTGIDRRHVGRALASLKKRNIITCQGEGYRLEYGLQKNHELWKFATIRGNEFATISGNDLPPSEAMIEKEICHHFGSNLPPSQGLLPPSEATNLPPSGATTKAIKHLNKSINKSKGGYGGNLPEWVDRETWEAYLEMRGVKKKPPTMRAVELIIKKLEDLRATGQDVKAVLNQSIVNTWTDVYALKQEGKNVGTGINWRNTRQLPPRDNYTRPEQLRT